MAHKNRCPGIALRFAAMMLLMWNLQLSASTVTWTGAGAQPAWSATANWLCNGAACGPPMTGDLTSTANVTFPGGLISAQLGPVDTTATSGITLNSLTITGSEYTAFTINSGVTLTINTTVPGVGSSSTFDLTGTGTKVSSISNGGTIAVTGVTLLTNESGIFLNSGATLTLSGTATIMNAGGTISNTAIGGTFDIGSSGATVQNGTLVGGVTNNGTINSVTFSGATVNGGSAISSGTLSGTSTANGTNSFGATFAVNNAGSLSAGAGGSVHWFGGANSGTLSSGSGALTVSGTVTNTGTINGATVNGTVNGGTITGTTAGLGGTFNNVLFAGASLVNGTIGGAGNTATGTNTLGGAIANTGSTLAITSGVTTVAAGGDLSGAGTVDVSGGTLNIASGGEMTGGGALDETSGGVVTLSGTLTVATANLMGGSFDGTGSFDGGTVTNDGVDLDVNGSAAAWAGSATLGDYDFTNYAQGTGGTLSINFSATGNDELVDTTDTTLAGALDLLNQNGSGLSFGSLTDSSYVLIADMGTAVAGTFSSLNVALPTGWSLVYNGANTPGGDAGDVELDFTAPPAVPEPTTDILLAAAIVGLAVMRKKLVKR
jgi:hypothetical protein